MNIAKFPDIIKTEECEDDEDALWSMLKVALENALIKLREMRSEEGKKLAQDIQDRCNLLKKALSLSTHSSTMYYLVALFPLSYHIKYRLYWIL